MDDSSSTPATPGRPFIKRPRLTRLLDEAQARVLMLVAPAGYGKTTLAHEWLEGRRGASAWYTCIPASADVAALAVGIGEAAAAVVPGAAERLRTRLRVTNAPEREVEVLAELLAEDLASWPEDAWLCLDDYHFTRRSPAAEQLVERLLALAPLRLLIATRERPSWASARRILYGELVELGTSALAMTHEEAGEVLAAAGPARLPGVLALTDGWPAAIGLAAVMPDFRIPEEGLPSQLYEYIAEELYQSADPELQLRLCQLAVAPQPTLELLEYLFGEEAQSVVEDAIRLGFLTARGGGSFDLHPLLRAFLEEKLRERSDAVVSRITNEVSRYLIANRRWDEAFTVADRNRDGALLVSLIESSFDDLLAEGRLTTMVEWLGSPAIPQDHPIADLIQSEAAFREGRYAASEMLARQAATQLSKDSPVRANALCVAGRAAYFRDRYSDSIHFYHEAQSSAKSVAVLRASLRGEVISSAELEVDGVNELIERLEALPRDVDSDLQLHATRLYLSTYRGNTLEGAMTAEDALHLLPKSQDPLIRSSFLHVLSGALLLCARYRDTLRLVDLGLQEAERYRLTFVWPQVLTVKAGAELGLRNFRTSLKTLHRLEAHAIEQDDARSLMNVASIRLRIRIAERTPDRGLRETRLAWGDNPAPAAYGEHLALRALALACAGKPSEAAQLADRAERVTSHTEMRVIVACTRAILALIDSTADPQAAVRDVADIVATSGYFDSLITAYRGFPPLLREVAPLLGDALGGPIHEARDEALAQHAGVDIARPKPSRRGGTTLSRREEDVHRLLAQGLTNRQIADTLFISESTAKVHVRNVLRKLNVRSRTEAALIAADHD